MTEVPSDTAAQGSFIPDWNEGSLVDRRFCLMRLLGQTAATATWLASDQTSGDQVVLKAFQPEALPPGLVMRLEHEAVLLAQQRSPYFASLLGLGRQGGALYLVSQYMPGATLAERLQAGRLDLNDGVRLARGLLSALDDLHRVRILHRGVRPSNLIINQYGPVITTALVDAVASCAAHCDAQVHRSIGSALYLSPEQAGSVDRDLTESSDLYSAGAVLYHALAGRPLFQSETLGEVLFKHMTAPVPDLRSLGLSVPRSLDELLARLLRKDPRDRYQTAEAVLFDLDAIADGLARGQSDPTVVIGSCDRRCTLVDPAFVGCDEELREIDGQIAAVRAGEGGLVLLEGESGGGKSCLLAEAMGRAARHALSVFRGQGTVAVSQRPFRLLDGIVQDLLAARHTDPAMLARLRKRLGAHVQAVCAALPELGPALRAETPSAAEPKDRGLPATGPSEGGSLDLPGGNSPGPAAPELFGENRTIVALALFLDLLGTREKPALVVLDDCQWADELTYKLLRRWQTMDRAASSSRYVTVVGAFRAEEVSDEHLLRKTSPSAQIRLRPFSPDEIRRLIESMAGPLPRGAVEVVQRLAGGSPFMASAVLRGLVESGALVASAGGWSIEPLALDSLQSSSQAAELLMRRLELLPAQAIRLLSGAAVLGKEFELGIAAHLAGQSASEAILALDEAQRRRLAWPRPDGDRCVLVHDRIRSALLERMGDRERRDLHHRAALYLQQYDSRRISDLAYHFDASGDSAAALPYAIQAAEAARTQHALEAAEEQYQIALRGTATGDRATRFRVLEGLGDVLMLRGRYEAAQQWFEEAAPLAQGSYAQAQIRGRLGELAFKRGRTTRAIADSKSALRLLGEAVPRGRVALFAQLTWEAGVQILHSLLPRWFVHRRKEPLPASLRLALKQYSNLGLACWYCDLPLAVWAHLRELNRAEPYPPSAELAHAYSEHAPAMTLVPGAFGRGVRYAKKSLEMRRNLNDLWGQGQTLVYYGITLYAAARYEECLEKSREAIRLLERLGDYWQVHMARYQVAACLYHLGDHAGAMELARLNRKSGFETGDEQAASIILDLMTRASHGDVPQSVVQTALRRGHHDVQGAVQVLLAKGVWLLESGDPAAASSTLEEAMEAADKARLYNAYTLPCIAWAATACRCLAEEIRDLNPARRDAALERAAALARRAIRAARRHRHPHDLARAYREYALVQAMQGRTGRAARLLKRSLCVAGRLGEQWERAQTLLAWARIGREVGWPDVEERTTEAHLILGRLGAMATAEDEGKTQLESLSLVDRFDAVLDAGRRIASALSPSAIHAESCAAALRLLRAEHCVVLPAEAVPEPPGHVAVSQSLVERALQAGRAVSSCDMGLHAGPDVPAGDEQSALCVPLSVRGQAVACLYLVHTRIRALFGPDEERLADFVATIAGAALENADGFAELQRLNATLEQRVTERTAAAEARTQELLLANEELERVADVLRRAREELSVAKQAAEDASRAKSRFLATMSHEIRTPMNGVLGMTELALRTVLTSQQRNYLETVKQSANSLLTLLNDVLDLAKIEAGKMELESIAFSLSEVVEDAVRLFTFSASQKGVELRCRIHPDVPDRLLGDPVRLRQVLLNLVGNALKFTAQGEIAVQVRREAGTDGQQILHFSVRDTGIGIPPEKRQSIFQAFSQSDNSTTRCYGGTGLGLTICSEIASLMGGRIWVESEVGRGSTFHVAAPFPSAPPASPPASPALGSGESEGPEGRSEPPEPARPLNVLVADDSPVNQEVALGLLEVYGHRGRAVENGREAVEAVQRERFDAVFMDLEMPEMDGLAATRAIRAAEADSSRHVPIYAMTAHFMAGIRDQCLAAGMDGYVSKPIEPAQLLETLRTVPPQVAPSAVEA